MSFFREKREKGFQEARESLLRPALHHHHITDPDYLNASFLFYDENKELVQVKVADALDNTRMGYEYEKVEMPWRYFQPEKRDVGAKIEDSPSFAKLKSRSAEVESVFPLTLDKTVTVLVRKQKPGQSRTVLHTTKSHQPPPDPPPQSAPTALRNPSPNRLITDLPFLTKQKPPPRGRRTW